MCQGPFGRKADVDKTNWVNATPLHMAAAHGDAECVKVIVNVEIFVLV